MFTIDDDKNVNYADFDGRITFYLWILSFHQSASQVTINIFSLTFRSILPTSFWTPTVCQTWIPELPHQSPTPAIGILWPFNFLTSQLTNLKQTHILTRQSVTYILTNAVTICLQKTVKRINHLFQCRLLVWQNNEGLEKSTISTLYQRLNKSTKNQ